jgi:hypothetical protein
MFQDGQQVAPPANRAALYDEIERVSDRHRVWGSKTDQRVTSRPYRGTAA